MLKGNLDAVRFLHLNKLESFQTKIGKQILGISKYHSNISTLVGLQGPSVKSRILNCKLRIWAKLLTDDESLSGQVFCTLVYGDVYIIQQYHSLEQQIGTNHLQHCLHDPASAYSIVQEAKTDIDAKDWEHTPSLASSHPSLSVITATHNITSSWNCIWDEALEQGTRGTKLMQHLFGTLSRPLTSHNLDTVTN